MSHSCTVFIKLDPTKGYYQVPMTKGDIPMTAVITPFGLFEWIRMSFGLRMMDQILSEIPHCFVHVDDMIRVTPPPMSTKFSTASASTASTLPSVNSLNKRLSILVARDVFLSRSSLTSFPLSLTLRSRRVSNDFLVSSTSTGDPSRVLQGFLLG